MVAIRIEGSELEERLTGKARTSSVKMMNMRTARLFFAVTLSIFVCAVAHAELKWEQTAVELHPAATDKEAVGHFKYQNTGNKPVRIESVHTSCGCTDGHTEAEEVPTGEQG